MIYLYPPLAETADEAIDWLEERGEIVRVVLYEGDDGLIRGAALVRPRPRDQGE